MPFDIRQADLAKLNSLTKYPAIPTYHALDGATGQLLEEALVFGETVIGTEKIDGTNARLIFLPDGSFVIGSRENLLYGKGDLIGDPAQGIVAALKETAERVGETRCRNDYAAAGGYPDRLQVLYLEVFGGNVSAASKEYTGARNVSCRLFDAIEMRGFESFLDQDAAQLARWRDAGGQPFLEEGELRSKAEALDLPLVPRLFTLDGAQLPGSVAGMTEFLREWLPVTTCALDEGAAGRPEGIVLRTVSRSVIAKARFEEYARTLKKRMSSK